MYILLLVFIAIIIFTLFKPEQTYLIWLNWQFRQFKQLSQWNLLAFPSVVREDPSFFLFIQPTSYLIEQGFSQPVHI